MACLLNNCLEFTLCSTGSDEAINELDDSADQLLWSDDLVPHSAGEFSHAVVQANATIEDHSLVEVADGAIFVGVYDGHGGDAASMFVLNELFTRFNRIAKESHSIDENVLEEAIAETETEFLNLVRRETDANSNMKSVGTCCLAGVVWRGTLYVANAGDSRLVIGQNKCPSGGIWAEQLTEDDNCRRVSVRTELREANPSDPGIVCFAHGSWRVRGFLEVSKSIGDAFLKDQEFAFPHGHAYFARPLSRPALSAIPNVHVRKLKKSDQFLIFASDGLWDMISNKRAVMIVRNNPRHGIAKRLIQEAMREAAKKSRLTREGLRCVTAGPDRRMIHDDISVVVVYIDSQETETDLLRRGEFGNGSEPRRFDLHGIH